MKTLVVYASKTGVAEELAQKIARTLTNAASMRAGDVKPSALEQYDQIIVGTALYMGSPRGQIKKFLKANEPQLLKKRLAFFTTGASEAAACEQGLRQSISPALTHHAVQIRHLGGELRLQRMNGLERWIIKQVGKQQPVQPPCLDPDALSAFCLALMA